MSNAHFVQPEMKFVLVAICKILDQNKIKNQKYHNRKTRKINNSNTYIHDLLLSWFEKCTLIKKKKVFFKIQFSNQHLFSRCILIYDIYELWQLISKFLVHC